MKPSTYPLSSSIIIRRHDTGDEFNVVLRCIDGFWRWQYYDYSPVTRGWYQYSPNFYLKTPAEKWLDQDHDRETSDGNKMNSEENKFTAYITKYALTIGIFDVQAKTICSTSIKYLDNNLCNQYAHANEWHRTLSDAIVCANEMRAKKIASLKKQIAKLEVLNFE